MTVATTFTTTSPGDGSVVGEFPSMGAEEVAAVVDRARLAARWWADQSLTERRRRLLRLRALLASRADEISELIHRESGKPVADALLEVVLSVDHVDWAAKHCGRVLGSRSVRPGLLTLNQQARLRYEPLGVIGVIGPWNYPLFTPVGSIAYAIAAGNAVVFKPSEYTTAVGRWLADLAAEVFQEHPVLSLATGPGSTGAALVRSGVDKISFTGSTATGRRIMADAAARLTPVLLELGGKDAVLVDRDADLDRAAEAAVFGAFSNGGQTCVGVERVYVHRDVYQQFLDIVADKASRITPGAMRDAAYGPMTLPSQVDVVRRHVADALERGGTPIVGGPDSIGERVIAPIVLSDVPEDSAAVLEETFGPTVVINPVRDLDEAVDRANATPYGLAASIFGGSPRRLRSAADRLEVGMVSINSWVMYAGVPGLPWGGVRESGFGRIHGEDGLREFARAKSTVRERFSLPVSLTSFERHPSTTPLVKRLVQLRYGRVWGRR
jgi:succinate-semialdehyde dehydrogenase/glutarate-semialdehyde dehydrogenase